ncbi:X-Pro dipeptidyl-peptidase protein [Exophiala viscosa]|uniref:X-Pro dipeptidyl-peptidase protein n=1 Tax=Exophiala viscosa TaxID=2486360 RepID=UPI00219C47EF|nr:X-Pro dipeptidyl-peptidase protein [Exophiala viscosa]
MPNKLRDDLHKIDDTSFDYIYEENATVQLKEGRGIVRCNVFRPKRSNDARYPVLVTYGPYGKDVHYKVFHAESFGEVPEEHHSPHSAWETPDPGYWTRHGYAIVRADEVGLGQSPGVLNTMSRDTSLCFVDVIEWAAAQPWSSGKIGLLGISYYAGSQWRVAARRPKGLACMVPWEGMSDYYRDRCRHGGILSNTFIDFWWNRQVIVNQYGRPGRAARRWGPDTIEGNLDEDELRVNCHDQNVDNVKNCFLDDEYYATKDYKVSDIEVPLLSVGNWGGILLHLRGNVEGFINAGSKHKYLRFITGRHDLPFYTKECVDMQHSFLDAFLKGHDPLGWSRDEQPRVGYKVRIGDVGFNDAAAEGAYPERYAEDWPIPTTKYTHYYLTPSQGLVESAPTVEECKLSYGALGDLKNQHLIQFTSEPFKQETEFTGHLVAHLNVSVTRAEASTNQPSDIDLFITVRHLSSEGKEILYTGTVGDPVPVTKGWLRVSLRKVNEKSPRHQRWHPHREYLSSDHAPLSPGEIYPADVEIWPTNVVMSPGSRLVLEISSGDTQGAGLFEHNSNEDRNEATFNGMNHVHFGKGYENWLLMPLIPAGKNSE